MRDMKSNLSAALTIYPAALGAGAKTGDAIVDLVGYNGALIVCFSGALSVNMPFQLMHGDAGDLGDAAAVPDASLVGTEPTLLEATDNEVKIFAYIGGKRYLRVDTTAGTGIGGAIVIKGLPAYAPTA